MTNFSLVIPRRQNILNDVKHRVRNLAENAKNISAARNIKRKKRHYSDHFTRMQSLICKTAVFSLKSLKKKRLSKARSADCRASLARPQGERGGKKRLSAFHTANLFRPGGLVVSPSCQKFFDISTYILNLIALFISMLFTFEQRVFFNKFWFNFALKM